MDNRQRKPRKQQIQPAQEKQQSGQHQDRVYAPGVIIRTWLSGKTTLRIQFYYKAVVCRETLGIPATEENIQYAIRLRGEIINAIERKTFSYANFFPDSKNALRFGESATRILIGELLDTYLTHSERIHEKSTYIRLKRVIKNSVKPYFGQIAIQDLKPITIRKFLSQLNCKRKTVSNILMPLRAVVEQALVDEHINTNPFDKIVLDRLLDRESLESDFEVDPFNKIEMETIIAKAEGQIKNLYQFAFFTGLRPSELMGLRWSDIDWINEVVRIRMSIVDKEKKNRTKTKAGKRDVLLFPPAKEALLNQKAYTYFMGGYVFHNPNTKKYWETSQQLRRTAWMPLLARAGVSYRNPYQTRHTYASMLISNGENLMWVSKQMGHRNVQTTIRNYARWLPETSVRSGYESKTNWDQYKTGT